MHTIEIPCHPLSRKMLLAQYGAEPITLSNQDPLFDMLSAPRVRPSTIKNRSALTANITLLLDDRIARHISENLLQIGYRLFRYHKPMLCWFVAGAYRAKGRGVVWGAIEDFLRIHNVDEDEYGTETAHKLYQRFGWNFDEKNPLFSGRMREKAGVKMSRKKMLRAKQITPVRPLSIAMRDLDVELAIGRFLIAYSQAFTRTPECLPKHVRVYTYITMQNLSVREASAKLGISRTGVHNSLVAFKSRMRRNPAVQRLFSDACALPDIK